MKRVQFHFTPDEEGRPSLPHRLLIAPFITSSCLASGFPYLVVDWQWMWYSVTYDCALRTRNVGSRPHEERRREAVWWESIPSLQSGLHVLTLTFISRVTLYVFLSFPSLCFFTWKKESSYFYLIEFNKGPNEIKCEATCADLGTQHIVLNASYFFSSFSPERCPNIIYHQKNRFLSIYR